LARCDPKRRAKDRNRPVFRPGKRKTQRNSSSASETHGGLATSQSGPMRRLLEKRGGMQDRRKFMEKVSGKCGKPRLPLFPPPWVPEKSSQRPSLGMANKKEKKRRKKVYRRQQETSKKDLQKNSLFQTLRFSRTSRRSPEGKASIRALLEGARTALRQPMP